jgi:alkylmercury lyase-like protein
MLAFRSEEHIARWCESRGSPRGASFSLEQAWELGRRWYEDKLSPEWRRATPEEAEAVFADVGLTGDFWRLRA